MTPIGPHEIAVMLNVSRQRVQQLLTQDDTFPAPWVTLATGRIWKAEDVSAWAKKAGRAVRPPGVLGYLEKGGNRIET